MSKICDFDITLNTECNLQHLDDFERDEADTYLRRTGLLHVKEKGMTICYIRNRCLVMFLRGGFLRSIDKTSSQS